MTEEELKRQAQLGLLQEPVSTTMPVDGAPTVTPVRPKVAPVVGRAPSGYDQANWDNPDMNTVKYDAGRLLYGKTKPSDVGATVNSAAFQQRFPGATFNGKDMVDFKGALAEGDSGDPVGLIDVLMAADAGGDTSQGLWWGAPDTASAPAASGSGISATDPRMDNSALARIMEELQAASTDRQSPAEREAILAMLQDL